MITCLLFDVKTDAVRRQTGRPELRTTLERLTAGGQATVFWLPVNHDHFADQRLRQEDWFRTWSESGRFKSTGRWIHLSAWINAKIPPAPLALNVEATRKCRCVGVCGQVAGVLPGPGGLLPAEDRETPEQSVSVPPAEQTHCLRVFRSGDERAAVWCVVVLLCCCVVYLSFNKTYDCTRIRYRTFVNILIQKFILF